MMGTLTLEKRNRRRERKQAMLADPEYRRVEAEADAAYRAVTVAACLAYEKAVDAAKRQWRKANP